MNQHSEKHSLMTRSKKPVTHIIGPTKYDKYNLQASKPTRRPKKIGQPHPFKLLDTAIYIAVPYSPDKNHPAAYMDDFFRARRSIASKEGA